MTRLGRCLALLGLAAAQCGAATPVTPNRSDRHAWQAAAQYLQLSPAQWQQMLAARSIHDRAMAALAQQAGKLVSPRDAAAKAQLCQRSKLQMGVLRDELHKLMSAQQLALLDQLEQAFALMPLVESAQAAGLIADRLDAPPVGLPQQQVVTASTWQRATPRALPGCPAHETHIRPGMIDSHTAQPGPVPAASQAAASLASP